MAQIFSRESSFEQNGDYALLLATPTRLFRERCNNIIGDIPFIALRFNDDFYSFLSAEKLFDGSADAFEYKDTFPIIENFNYGWLIPNVNTLGYGIRDVMNDYISEIKIVQERMSLDMFIMGVEVESSEPNASDNFVIKPLISNEYTDREYCGFSDYHSSHRITMNTPVNSFRGHRIGVELEVEFNHDDDKEDFVNIERNWYFCERDGSLNDNGCEIVTIPLLPKHAKSEKFWSPLVKTLRKLDAVSWDSRRCGLHVHIGREILGKDEEERSETIGKLLYLYHHSVKDTRLNIKIYGRSEAYNDHDGKTREGDATKLLGKEVLKIKEVQGRVKDSMIYKSHETRYFDINLQNGATIEFRKGKGSINENRIVAIVEYSELMCKYAKITPWQQIDYADFVNYLKITAKGSKLKEMVNAYC